jgi:cyclic-di-GMP phosphodiesterase TipF (flagellum assembly factor)
MPQVSDISSRRRVSLGDLAVLVAISLVAAAFGTGLVVNAGVGSAMAIGIAALCWLAMASAHTLVRRERLVTAIGRELERLEGQIGRMTRAEALSPEQMGIAPAPTRTETSAPSISKAEAPVVDPEPVKQGEADQNASPPQLPPEFVRAAEHNVIEAGARRQAPGPDGIVPTRDGETQGADTAESGGASRPAPTHIDKIIKRLADDITAGRRKGGEPASANERPMPSLDLVVPQRMDPPSPPVAAVPAPPAPSEGASAKVAAIAEALMQERIDVFLEPILGLDDHQARHYEVSARLRLADGSQLDQKVYSTAVRGTGLLPLIDAVKISHTKRVALQLINRGRSGSFFSQVNGEALATSQFGEDVGTITGRDPAVAARLVLSFSQSDVRGFTPLQVRSLEQLKDLGFRFAMESVTDLDMDFDQLVQNGFVFAKLDADVFVAGLPAPDGPIPAADICRFLAEAGLTLIVQSIESERQLGEILGFGALYGQGALFGGPRPVKAHVLRGESTEDVAVRV